MSIKRRRELNIEELDVDDIEAIPRDIRGSPLSQAAENIENEEEADDVIGKMREGLITTLLNNPFLKVEAKNSEGITLLNSLTEEQLRMMEFSFKHQLSEVIDRGVSKNICDAVCGYIPYVNTATLKKDIENDALFQQAFNSLISVQLCKLPDICKVAFLAGVHLVRNINGRSTAMVESAIEAPVSNVDMREVESGEEHSDREFDDEDALL